MKNTPMMTDSQLDSLVDGELAEGERRELLLRIDQQPDQWKRVALAFLEAQSFRAALQATVADTHKPTPTPPVAQRQSTRARRYDWARGAVLAAIVLLAFLLGMAATRSTATTNPVAQATTVQESALPVAQAAVERLPLVLSRSLSAEARLELERRGFAVQEQPRLVHVDIQGQSVPVYFHQITVRYVGNRSLL